MKLKNVKVKENSEHNHLKRKFATTLQTPYSPLIHPPPFSALSMKTETYIANQTLTKTVHKLPQPPGFAVGEASWSTHQ